MNAKRLLEIREVAKKFLSNLWKALAAGNTQHLVVKEV